MRDDKAASYDSRFSDDPIEPLSKRELEILALLSEDLSNQEIAERLVIAYTTVKWYNRQIFSKLGVQNRDQAVERAFALKLLKSPEAAPLPTVRLPAQITPFIGREAELADLTRVLSDPRTRFLTLLAPGGMGKTRLALAAAERLPAHFADGVYFVPLAPVTSIEQLVPAIADTIGVQFFPDSRPPKQQLLDFLRMRNMLLVLDNFEHLLDDAPLVEDILNAAPGVKAMVTSRERLSLTGESVYTLGGLPYPAQGNSENPLEYSAAQLFVQSARRANARFTADDVASITRIVQLVQGMPLAIELAAAWVGTLSPAEIADEISRSADFLRTTMRNAPERLRSIRAVFEATWRRLSADERQAFRRLSVFRGGCTREAAQAVTGADLSRIAALVDKALLRRSAGGGRFEIHELLRQYAEEQLQAAGEAEAVKTVHRQYFAALAQEWGRALKTSKQLEAIDVLEADLDNLRDAFRRAIDIGQPDAIEPFTDLWYFYEMRARIVEGHQLWAAAIDAVAGEESLALGKLLVGQAIFYERFHNYEQEWQLTERSIAIFRRFGAERELPFALAAYGVGLSSVREREKAAKAAWDESLVLARRFDDQWVMPILLVCFAALKESVSLDEAKRLYWQAYALIQSTGNEWGASFILRNLGSIALMERDYAEAQKLYHGALASAQKIHHMNNVCIILNALSRVALLIGDLVQAQHRCAEMLIVSGSIGDRHATYWATTMLAEIALARHDEAQARQLLQDALAMFPELTNPTSILGIGVVSIPLLAYVGARTEALLLISFLRRGYLWNEFLPQERDALQALHDQLKVIIPVETYDAVWASGQTITQDDLLIWLRGVIQTLPR